MTFLDISLYIGAFNPNKLSLKIYCYFGKYIKYYVGVYTAQIIALKFLFDLNSLNYFLNYGVNLNNFLLDYEVTSFQIPIFKDLAYFSH